MSRWIGPLLLMLGGAALVFAPRSRASPEPVGPVEAACLRLAEELRGMFADGARRLRAGEFDGPVGPRRLDEWAQEAWSQAVKRAFAPIDDREAALMAADPWDPAGLASYWEEISSRSPRRR